MRNRYLLYCAALLAIVAFFGSAAANAGGYKPRIDILKQVSLTGGEPFFDADTEATAPTGTLGADATYRLIVRNIGEETLVNALINDEILGLVDVPVPGGPLAPGEERTIVDGDVGFGNLFSEYRCDKVGIKNNIASVKAKGERSHNRVSDDDPANVNCAEPPEPMIELLKQVSLTGGEPFFDADTEATAPTGTLGADATYWLIVRNIGDETLVNALINDQILGLVDVPVPGGPLAPGEERIIVDGDVGFENLFVEDRCDSAGNKLNIALVDAEGEGTGNPVSDKDPANVNCAEPMIELLKQVSLTGGGPFFDADTEATAPTGTLGADATYRLIVRNIGDETLVNALINDEILGLVDVPVPGGPLAPGEERTIVAGDVGFENLFSEDRCDRVGIKNNIALVDAEGEGTGNPVSDDDPANVNCAELPEPMIELLKQVSLTGGEPFVDADTERTAPTGTLGADATYRLIVRNIGDETLVNALINDQILGLVDVPVPGGPLEPGDERVIGDGDVGFENLFVEDRCDSAGNKLNIALVDAEGEGTGNPVSDKDPANVNCDEPPPCNIEVDKQCVVSPPPTPVGGNCKDIKDITAVKLVWDGAGEVNISGEGGTFSRIQPGDLVTINTPDKDTDISISGVINGTSTFHVSCSDDDMNGPEDCATLQGDGKKGKGGNVNQWLFAGMIGEKGAFDCPQFTTPLDGNGADSCTITPTGQPSCDTIDKPDTLTWRYDGGTGGDGDCGDSTFATAVNAKGKPHKDFKCSGGVDVGAAISVFDDKGGTFNVAPGESFTTELKASKRLNLSNGGGSQSLEFHTSCSQPIAAGLTAGALTIEAMDGQGGSSQVTYNYTVTNIGDTDALNILVVDDPSPGTPFEVDGSPIDSLAPGESVTLTEVLSINVVTTNTVIVTGETSGGSVCEASDTVIVEVEAPPPVAKTCKDIKAIQSIGLIWNGPGPISVNRGPTIQQGERVTILTPKKDTNVSISGAVTGTSAFHVSCSDKDMDGSEDCGKLAGNGKKDDSGLVNQWLFDGMTGEKGSFTCSP